MQLIEGNRSLVPTSTIVAVLATSRAPMLGLGTAGSITDLVVDGTGRAE